MALADDIVKAAAEGIHEEECGCNQHPQPFQVNAARWAAADVLRALAAGRDDCTIHRTDLYDLADEIEGVDG